MVFQRAGAETKEHAFVIEVYAQIIEYLEPRRSAGRIRNHLADFYRNVIHKAEKAKELWLEVQHSLHPHLTDTANPLPDSQQQNSHQHHHRRRRRSAHLASLPQRLRRHLPPIPHLLLPTRENRSVRRNAHPTAKPRRWPPAGRRHLWRCAGSCIRQHDPQSRVRPRLRGRVARDV